MEVFKYSFFVKNFVLFLIPVTLFLVVNGLYIDKSFFPKIRQVTKMGPPSPDPASVSAPGPESIDTAEADIQSKEESVKVEKTSFSAGPFFSDSSERHHHSGSQRNVKD